MEIIDALLSFKFIPSFKELENDEIYLLIAGGFFIISALGIIFNPAIYGVKRKIQGEVNRLESKNDELFDKINELSSEFVNHNIYIKQYVAEKETLSSLEKTIENGLSYVDESKDIYVYLNEVSRTFVKIIGELLDVGIDNLNERIIKNKFFILDKAMYEEKKYLVTEKYLNKLKKIRKEDNKKEEKIINSLIEIKDDEINSKEERFRTLSESFLHELLRDIILLYNKQNQKNE